MKRSTGRLEDLRLFVIGARNAVAEMRELCAERGDEEGVAIYDAQVRAYTLVLEEIGE